GARHREPVPRGRRAGAPARPRRLRHRPAHAQRARRAPRLRRRPHRPPRRGRGDRRAVSAESVPARLTEGEALELLAFLVTAARTQMDEAAEYGPLRLLTAAGRLAAFLRPRASARTRDLLDGALARLPDVALRAVDPARFAAELDVVCAEVARH